MKSSIFPSWSYVFQFKEYSGCVFLSYCQQFSVLGILEPIADISFITKAMTAPYSKTDFKTITIKKKSIQVSIVYTVICSIAYKCSQKAIFTEHLPLRILLLQPLQFIITNANSGHKIHCQVCGNSHMITQDS